MSHSSVAQNPLQYGIFPPANRPSRSIIQNRIEPFARLFDPDEEPEPPEPSPVREAPARRKDSGRLVSLPFVLKKGKSYTRYRLTRLATNPHCCFCGCELDEETASLDHVLPKSKGGDNWPANLILACTQCNSEKSSQTFAEWRDVLMLAVQRLNAILESLQRLIDSRLEECLPTPKVMPKKQVRTPSKATQYPGQEGTVSKSEFRIGRRSFSIIRVSDRKVLVRHIRGTDLRHYLDSVGFDNNGPIALIAEEFWHPLIGGDTVAHAERSHFAA